VTLLNSKKLGIKMHGMNMKP